MQNIPTKLKDFSNNDYLLAMGDPVAIAVASMVASDINKYRGQIRQILS